DWTSALRYAARLERVTASEPLAWSNYMVRRARALSAIGQGSGSDTVVGEISALKLIAEQAGLSSSRERL
ncbi:MAG: hypothetical protein AAF636_24675, partial [Pseudomonadota bacterium]